MTSETASVPTYVYATYIRASAEQVWQALTDADLTARYWGHANVSDWQPGSAWEHRRVDGSGRVDVVGRVLEAEPPTRLVITFEEPGNKRPGGPSVVTFLVEPHHEIVRLTVTHENLADQAMLGGIWSGWPAVIANLKSLLETGDVLPQIWEMPRPLATTTPTGRLRRIVDRSYERSNSGTTIEKGSPDALTSLPISPSITCR